MATLEKRVQTPGQPPTWRVRWWADGKQRSKSFKSGTEAKRFKAVLEGDMVNGNFVDPKHGAVTLSSFVQGHAESILIDVRVSTRNRIEGIYRTHVLPEFGHMPLTAITGSGVSHWVTKMNLSLNPSSVRKNVFALRRVLDVAVHHGLIKANPASGVKLPAEPRHEQRFLTHDESWTLAETINPRFRAMALLAVFGGMRFGELCALQRMHIIPERNQVAVRQTMVEVNGRVSFGPPKTKTSVRVVTIPRSIMDTLVEHMDTYCSEGPDALVFTGERGTAIQRHWFSRYYWKPAAANAGLSGLRFHDLRHTFVALWISLGRNAKEVSKAAGHSSVAFTLDRYGHLYETDSDGLADELDVLLGHARTRHTAGETRNTARPGVGTQFRRHVDTFHGGASSETPGQTPDDEAD